MTKRKKQKRSWRIPKPTPYDAMLSPNNGHMLDLIEKLAEKRKESESQIIHRYGALFNAYMAAYAKQVKVLDPSEFSNMDLIDLSDFTQEQRKKEETNMTKFLADADWAHPAYLLIPCYERGLLRVNAHRTIYFEQKDVQTDFVVLYLQDYVFTPDGQITLGVSCTARFSVQKGETLRIQCDILQQTSFLDMYTRLSPRALNWTSDQVTMWESLALQNAVDQEARMALRDTSSMLSLVEITYKNIIFTNYCLSSYRPVMPPSSKKEEAQRRSPAAAKRNTAKEPPERRIVTVGAIRLRSASKPRPFGGVRQYHLKEWNVRGHIRRYKSGKVVYIKPSARRRRSLMEDKDTAGFTKIPTTLHIKGAVRDE